MGKPNTQHIKHPTSGVTQFADYNVGDLIRIRGSSDNNGIFTCTEITDDGTNSYMGVAGAEITTDDTNDSAVYIDRLGTGGDTLIIIGNEDSGTCSVWSYNYAALGKSNAASGTGLNRSKQLKSPFVGSKGWSKNAISTSMTWAAHHKNLDVKYDFLIADGAVRVCDTNSETISVIKKYGPINHIQFNHNMKGGHHLGFEEHINTLAKPVYGGYVTAAATSTGAYFTGSAAYQIRKYIVPISTSGDHFFDLAIDGIQFDDTLLVGSEANASLIPLGMVFGLGGDTNNDASTSIGAERFMVRKVDISSLYFHVYRAYAGSVSADVDTTNFENIYRYGCGWNFKVAENSTVDSGTYMAGTWEFAQSFVYDGNQESLLRTAIDIGAANTLAQSNDFRALDIDIYAHGPYNGRITGGRIYIREASTDDEWSLLVDIDIVKGCRSSMEAEYTAWTDRSSVEENGMFSCGTLTSKGMQIDSYATINGYSHKVDRNSLGYMSENYRTSVVAGRRAFVANLRLTNSSSVVEKFGDRIMFSEPNKFDVFPDTNTIDVSKGDAEEYTALEYYADRLLAFKHKTLHIINIASPSPSGWFLEETVKHSGVSFQQSVIKTEYGICWANRTGCYLFDGSKIRNLIEGKIRATGTTPYTLGPSWDSFVTGSDYIVQPMLVYLPKGRKLIIQRCPNDSSTNSNQCYVYDFNVNAWVYDESLFNDNDENSNPILDWNNNPVVAVNGGFTGSALTSLTLDEGSGINTTATSFACTSLNEVSQGDLIKFDTGSQSEEVLIRDIDYTSETAGTVKAVRGWNGTTAASHADDAEATPVNVNFNSILNDSTTTGSGITQTFVTKDIDFGDPSTVKKVYKLYITYKNIRAVNQLNVIQFATDGNTAFAQSGVTPQQGATSTSLTGTFLASKSVWDIAEFTFSTPVPCQSIAFKLTDNDSLLWINDISIEYRILPAKRVA